ncbi:MAG: hypothetical protein AAGC93_19565 [Cyanobacteria bacterium P01_F01_bin.53]
MATLLVWSTLRTLHKGITHVRSLHQIPCHNCAFFTGDYRLKCTVEPITACTEHAIGCCHFEPQIKQRPSQQWKKQQSPQLLHPCPAKARASKGA